MYSSFFNFSTFFIIFFILLFMSISSIIPILALDNDIIISSNNCIITSPISSNFSWPIPGFTKITSTFGPRNKPTNRCF